LQEERSEPPIWTEGENVPSCSLKEVIICTYFGNRGHLARPPLCWERSAGDMWPEPLEELPPGSCREQGETGEVLGEEEDRNGRRHL
jgi:hypothetical protein